MKSRLGRRSLRACVAVAVVAVFVSAVGVPGMAAEPSGPSDCPEIFPVDQLTDGMLATGWTATGAEAGTETVESFNVEILGVLEDGIAPGRDLIVIKAYGPTIGQNGKGIWAGMSGSPVYHDGDLIGAVAYGLSWGPSKIGGVTPAADMADIPQTSATRTRVPLTRAERSDIAQATNTSTSEVGGSMVQLKTPFSIGGASKRATRKIAKVIDKENLPLLPYTGGTSGATAPGGLETTDTPPSPGESFAAAISYGDITFAGVGTTTMVCDDRALAFGHPFFWTGDSSIGAAKATAITVVPDTSGGSYKLANIDATFGMVDQDRLAGIAATVGNFPSVIPVVSTIEDLNTGTQRTGETLAVDSPYVSYITWIHLLSNSDVVIDRIGPGSSVTTWTLTGKREDGTDWSVTRRNRFTSSWDISYESIWEVESALYRILGQDFEDVTLESVNFDADFEKQVNRLRVRNILVSRNGSDFKDTDRIAVRSGDKLKFKVLLTDLAGAEHTETGTFIVPNKLRRSYFTASSGQYDRGSIECFTEPADCYSGGDTKFDKMLAKIANRPKNNDLLMAFRNGRKSTRIVRSQDQVVSGYKYIRIVRKDGGGGGVEEGTAKM